MQKAYVLAPGNEGAQGQLAYGANVETFDIGEELAGGNRIVTDDPELQVALEGLFAAEGPLFDVYLIDEEGNETEIRSAEAPESPGFIPRPGETSETPQTTPEAAQPTDAVHDEGYHSLPIHELRELARERGLNLPPRADKNNLVAALNAADSEAQSDGS